MQSQAQLLELENGSRSEDVAAAQANIADVQHQLELYQFFKVRQHMRS